MTHSMFDWRAIALLSERRVYEMPAQALLESLPDDSVGLVVLDPPTMYGTDPDDDDYTISLQISNLRPLAEHVSRILKPGGSSLIITGPTLLSAWEVAASWASMRLMLETTVLWESANKSSESMPSMATSVRWHIKPGYRYAFAPDMVSSAMSNVVICRQVDVLDRLSPAQRPVELFKYLIDLVTSEHDLVVDPFCGTGSALVAAHLSGRPWIGSDISGDMCRIARRRLDSHSHCELEYDTMGGLKWWVGGRNIDIPL